MSLGVLLISFSILILSGCSKYEKVSKTKFVLGKVSISSAIANGFLAGKRNHTDPTKNTVWSESISGTKTKITKELASGSWTFYGYLISEDTMYCAIQNEDLISSSQTVNVTYTTAKCLDNKLFSYTNGEFDFILCTEFNDEDPECFNNRSTAQSIKLASLKIDTSPLANLEISSTVFSDSGCISLENGKTTEDLPKYIQTSTNLPIAGNLKIFSDTDCQTEATEISFNHFLFKPETIDQSYLSQGYLLVLDSHSAQCIDDSSCPENHMCVSGSCFAGLGEYCTNASDCLFENCEDNICLHKQNGAACSNSSECASGLCEATCQQSSLFFNALSYNRPFDDLGEENGDNYILIPTSLEQNTLGISPNSDFSVSLWFKTNMRNRGMLFGQKDVSGVPEGQVGLAINGAPYSGLEQANIFRFRLNDKDNDIPSRRITETVDLSDFSLTLYDFNWHHLVIIRAENKLEGSVTLSIYFDSIEVASTTMSAADFPNPSPQQLFLGAKALYSDGTRSEMMTNLFFIGEMDEFSIFESALSTAEISTLYADERTHDLRYNFSGYESSAFLKTYLKMNINPNSEESLISFKNSDETFESSFEGTVKDDSTLNADFAPSTFINEENSPLIDINYKELGVTSSNFHCANHPFPASNAVDGNLQSFSHTNQACVSANQFFHFTEIIYLSSVEVLARAGADRRLRKLDFNAYADDGVTKNFNLFDETDSYLNNQEISFAPGTADLDYLKLIETSSAEFNFVDGYSSTYLNGEIDTESVINHQNLSQLIDTNKIEVERISDDYFFVAPGYLASQQVDDQKVLQMAELKAYGLEALGYEYLQEDCENGTRDYFETSVDCGGNFCPTLGPNGRCLEGEFCQNDRDCLSEECVEHTCTSPPGYVNGEFTATPTNVSLVNSRSDVRSIPKINVTGELGLTTQLCADENCADILGEFEHTEEQMEVYPDSGIADGDYNFYVRTSNGRDEGPIIGPISYTKFTPMPISSGLMNIRPSSSWMYDERSERLNDGLYTDDFGTGDQDSNRLDASDVSINMQSQHYVDIILERPVWLSAINLFNRTECCLDRVSDINIQLFDADNGELGNYYTNNDPVAYYTNTTLGSNAFVHLDITSSEPIEFGLGKTQKVKRIKITRHRHTGGFGYQDNEQKVQLGFTEITLEGTAPINLEVPSSISAPTNYALEELSVSTEDNPEFSVTNTIGNTTMLCEDANCQSVIGWVDHDTSEKTLTTMFNLPTGDYSFYFRSSRGAQLSEIVGPVSYTIYTPSLIPRGDLSMSGTQNWPNESLDKLKDGLEDNVGSTGVPDNQDHTGINDLPFHFVEVTFNEEKTISEIILVQRSGCCLDRIMDYDILIYGMVNGVETQIKSYFSNNDNRYFCEDRTYNNGLACSFAGGSEINFNFDSSDKEVFGLESPQKITKVKIKRYKNTNVAIGDGGNEKHLSIGLAEIKFKGYVP